MAILLLNILLVVPIATYVIARRKKARNLYGVSGLAFGIVVAPLSLGFYSLFFVSPWGLIPGLLGLGMSVVHEAPGFHLAISLGLVRGEQVASSIFQHVVVEVINAGIWASAYGFLGLAIDRLVAWRRGVTRVE